MFMLLLSVLDFSHCLSFGANVLIGRWQVGVVLHNMVAYLHSTLDRHRHI